MLNTGAHVQSIDRVERETVMLAHWLSSTRHDIIWRTTPPGHVHCERATAPLQVQYVPPSAHELQGQKQKNSQSSSTPWETLKWEEIALQDQLRASIFERIIPGPGALS